MSQSKTLPEQNVVEQTFLPVQKAEKGTIGTLNTSLLLLSLTTLLFCLIGYRIYQSDHLTQVPMLLKQLDPTLFPLDWFFQGSGQFMVRRIYIGLQTIIYGALGSIEGVLLLQYLTCMFLSICGLWWTCRILRKDAWQAIAWVLVLGCLNKYATLAATLIFDDIMIPRVYAYTACILAVPMILQGWFIRAGLLLGLAGLMQGAPTLQFLPLCILWLVSFKGMRQGLKQGAILFAAFLLGYWPEMLIAKDLVADNLYSNAEMIHWLAFIRHPHHMLPRQFPLSAYTEFLAPLVLVWTMLRRNKIDSSSKLLLNLVAVLIGFLLLSVIFIHGIPVGKWIAFQPMRMVPMVRLFMLYFLALHLVQLARAKSAYFPLRFMLWGMALANVSEHSVPMQVLIWSEAILILLEPRLSAVAYRRLVLALSFIAIFSWLPFGTSRTAGMLVAGILLATPWPRATAFLKGLRLKPSPLNLTMTAVTLNSVFYCLLWFWPFEAWQKDPREWSALDRLQHTLTTRFHVHPYPDGALELAATWARENTPKDALFIIPPARDQESFHIWSHRSIVFNVKMFAFAQDQWPMWIERYYAHGGLMEPEKSAEDAEMLYTCPGGEAVGDFYSVLSAPKMMEIARRYKADYIITPCQALTISKQFETVAGPFYSIRERMRSRVRESGLWILRVPKTSE